MKILVTGGAGYIGSFIVRQLAAEGHTPVIVDNLSAGHKEAVADFKLHEIDIVDQPRELQALFESSQFDGVIHMASLISVGESFKTPILYFQRNLRGALNVLEAMEQTGVKFIVLSSTAAVFGNPKQIPISEDSEKIPTNPYGESKLMIEKVLSWCDTAHGIKSVSIRYFNAAGAALDGSVGEDHPNESHLIPLLIKAAQKGSKFSVFGNDYDTPDGTCVRDYIHVLDLSTAHTKALKYLADGGESNQFNAGVGVGYSNKQIIDEVEKVTGKKIKVEYAPRREGDSATLVASNEKIKKLLDWSPRYGLKEIIESAYAWHNRNI